MNQWFGSPWPSPDYRAPVCEDDTLRIPTPVGSKCFLCEEEIAEDDQGLAMPGYIGAEGSFVPTPMYCHIECNLKNVMGCYGLLIGGEHTHDVPYREDAKRIQEWVRQGGRPS